MNIAIINGTNREDNKSQNISETTVRLANEMGHDIETINLKNFDTLFRGIHITLGKSNSRQQKDLQNMSNADVLLFVVPTYHTGIPSSLKNFFDTIKSNEAFDEKIIGVISSNDKNHDHGARQAVQIINGILAYNKLHSFVVPIIPVIDFGDINEERIQAFIQYCSEFMQVSRNLNHSKTIYE